MSALDEEDEAAVFRLRADGWHIVKFPEGFDFYEVIEQELAAVVAPRAWPAAILDDEGER